MKPTLDSLTEYLLESTKGKLNEEYTKTLAKAIHESFNPPMKPLSELHKDEEACREIAEYFALDYKSHELEEDGLLVIQGECQNKGYESEIMIWDDGDIFVEILKDPESISHPFSLVDKIRSLGYDVNPEEK